MSVFTKADSTSNDFISLNDTLINDNITYRSEWENEAKLVHYSYHGNKYPGNITNTRNPTLASTQVKKQPGQDVYVNLVKRQYRVMSNYLNNNEPVYVITGFNGDTKNEDEVSTRGFLDWVFQGQDPKLDGEDDENFYNTTMDETIYFGLFRGVVWTMAYWTKEDGYCFKTYDPLDTYIDTNARKLSKVRKFLNTYTKSKGELETEYPTDAFGEPIDWEEASSDRERTKSTAKQCMLPEPTNPDTFLIREGYYLEYEGKKRVVYKVITTATHTLEKEKVPGLNFLPVTWFTPLGEPEVLYTRGWYTDMLPLEREINLLIAKINNIVKTGGRFVYVREGTVMHKATNQLLNSLQIEVIEVSGAQALPEQAQLLQVSGEMLEWLNFLMAQADDEGGMQQDIMGSSSTGPDASGRAIQALQAGSKNNIGTALNELNKYMSRLVRIVLRMHDAFGDDNKQVYSPSLENDVTMKKETAKRVKVKVSITGADAFDEITKQAQSIEVLNMIKQFNPELVISPDIVTGIMDITNDNVDQIQKELDKQKDPDMQISDAENKKFLNGDPMNVNMADNHQTHMAIHTQMLQSIPPESPVAKLAMNHIRMHEALMQSNQQQ